MSGCSAYIKKNTGKLFEFIVQKEICYPDDKQIYYVIADKNNCKFTLPKKYYSAYGFKSGQKIICKLDHINCDGKIFFEPCHPHYTEGSSYKFKFITRKTIKNYLDIDEEIIVVKDELDQEQWIRYSKSVEINNGQVSAWVEKIKKGHLFLLPEKHHNFCLQPGQKYTFSVVKTHQTDRFGKVYIIQDTFKNLHALPIKYYKNYGLEQGTFFATVKRFSSKGFFYIEPDHPSYALNHEYPFRVIDKIYEGQTITYFLEDKLGMVTSLFSKKNKQIGNWITAKIIGFKKGTVILEDQ